MKIALGTAQFGLEYGIANKLGQIQKNEAREIFHYAKENGIYMLDTAVSYGESEQTLGELGVNEWQIITKLPAINEGSENYTASIRKTVCDSLDRLKVSRIYGLLLHDTKQLLQNNGGKIYQALEQIRIEGLVQKIGISIYDPIELTKLSTNYKFDIVQAPLNIFDRRIINSNWHHKLAEQNIELHVRSIFLQGLLLLSPDRRPEKFNRWNSLWSKWDTWIIENKITPLELCVNFAISCPFIDKVVIGIDSCLQLREILQSISVDCPEPPDDLQSEDLALINPFNWSEL